MRRNLAGLLLVLAGVALGSALGRAGLGATVQAQPQERDVLPALLTEVRGLRAAMERMAAAGPRVQLAMGRLQLQEQRVNSSLRRLEAVRQSLAGAQREEQQARNQIAGMEEMVRTSTDPAQVRSFEQELRGMKQVRHPELVAEVQRLQVEESSVAQEIGTEQSRWTDINQRLEELERSLGGR